MTSKGVILKPIKRLYSLEVPDDRCVALRTWFEDRVASSEDPSRNKYSTQRKHSLAEVNVPSRCTDYTLDRDSDPNLLVIGSLVQHKSGVVEHSTTGATSFGGIVGLCLGCSLLSLVEVLYFFTVRPACDIFNSQFKTNTSKVKTIKIAPIYKGTAPLPYDWLI
uniref:Uncharacterized protein n=1 Tax=Timema cristinae TaxID=61476 RepID=A0A7R9CWU0_TIMCR|nr:unnamed protein product [Timema cristinae]